MSNVEIRRAETRPHTKIDWLDSRHSFSFGRHYDPANTHHGLLLVSNDDRVAPASGFPPHFHRDMEIVTWVLAGRLEHRDSEGNHGELYPGLAQRMSAGAGIEHSEMNPRPRRRCTSSRCGSRPTRRASLPAMSNATSTASSRDATCVPSPRPRG